MQLSDFAYNFFVFCINGYVSYKMSSILKQKRRPVRFDFTSWFNPNWRVIDVTKRVETIAPCLSNLHSNPRLFSGASELTLSQNLTSITCALTHVTRLFWRSKILRLSSGNRSFTIQFILSFMLSADIYLVVDHSNHLWKEWVNEILQISLVSACEDEFGQAMQFKCHYSRLVDSDNEFSRNLIQRAKFALWHSWNSNL